jgi:hypothetical protein
VKSLSSDEELLGEVTLAAVSRVVSIAVDEIAAEDLPLKWKKRL